MAQLESDLLRTFLAVAEAGSVTEGAARVFRSQSAASIQIRKLEDAGYISVDKRIVDRKPLTTVRLTPQGRKAFQDYIKALSDVLGLPPQT